MNPLNQFHSGTAPEISQDAYGTNQGTNEDNSQSDPHAEASVSQSQTTRNFGPDNDYDMVTGVHEEVTYCSPSKSSRQQKKNRSASQPQFCSENTPATIKADQTLLALKQLANNNISAVFHNNIIRFYELPNSLTSTMPTFHGKSEKFELFDDFFQTSHKSHNLPTEDDKINLFQSLMRGDAIQTFKNINGSNRENLRENLAVFRRKCVKPQSMATAKHICQKLVFNPANQTSVNFVDELQKLARILD